MSIRRKIPLDVTLCMRLLSQENKLPICVIRKIYPSYSTLSVCRHRKEDISNKETEKETDKVEESH